PPVLRIHRRTTWTSAPSDGHVLVVMGRRSIGSGLLCIFAQDRQRFSAIPEGFVIKSCSAQWPGISPRVPSARFVVILDFVVNQSSEVPVSKGFVHVVIALHRLRECAESFIALHRLLECGESCVVIPSTVLDGRHRQKEVLFVGSG